MPFFSSTASSFDLSVSFNPPLLPSPIVSETSYPPPKQLQVYVRRNA